MTTINILHCNDGTYAVTVNGEVVAAGLLTNAAAWREAERLVESDNAEDANERARHTPTPILFLRQNGRLPH